MVKGKAIGLVMVILVLAGFEMVWGFSGGSGTEQDPYVITNVTELQSMQNDLGAYYELGNDIDASDTQSWNGGEGFEPVGPFTGSFDGRGYTIENFHIDRIDVRYQGLFGFLDGAVVNNVHFNNANIR